MLANVSQISTILDHDRVKVGWVLKPMCNNIIRIARVAIIFPKDGAGRLTVAVSDFNAPDGETRSYIGKASGFGYDKLTAAMVGATVGGVVLGDHCDHAGRPTLEALCAVNGYEWIRGY